MKKKFGEYITTDVYDGCVIVIKNPEIVDRKILGMSVCAEKFDTWTIDKKLSSSIGHVIRDCITSADDPDLRTTTPDEIELIENHLKTLGE